MYKASVILASYNRLNLLKNLLDSLAKQDIPLDQFEVIVVDNGSTDGSREFLRDFKPPYSFQYYQLEGNPGPAKARNLGVKNAQSEIVFFTDDDCVVPINWISSYFKVLGKHSEVTAVGGYQRAPEEILKTNSLAQYEWFISSKIYGVSDQEYIGGFETPGVVTNNMAIRKVAFEKVGCFDEEFVVAAGEDADLKKRLIDSGYKLMYYPLGVEHHHRYDLNRFIQQSFFRGIGSRHFQKKYNLDYSNSQLLRMMVITPLQSFFKILGVSKRLNFALIAALGEFYGLRGQLNYCSFVKRKGKIL